MPGWPPAEADFVSGRGAAPPGPPDRGRASPSPPAGRIPSESGPVYLAGRGPANSGRDGRDRRTGDRSEPVTTKTGPGRRKKIAPRLAGRRADFGMYLFRHSYPSDPAHLGFAQARRYDEVRPPEDRVTGLRRGPGDEVVMDSGASRGRSLRDGEGIETDAMRPGEAPDGALGSRL
jgi:hypothetical protein